jgi:hypothetical protein
MPAFSAAICLSVVPRKLGDAADYGLFDDIGGVKAAAQTHFDDAGVGGMLGEGKKGGGGGDFEEAGADPFCDIEDAGEIGGQRFVGNQLAADPDAFVEAHQMGRGEDMDGLPVRFERGAQEGAGRAFAVGASNMEDRRQGAVRIADAVEQLGDALQTQYVGAGRQGRKAVELGLDARIIGDGVVGHGACPPG